MNQFKNIHKTKPEILLSMFCRELELSSDFHFLSGIQPFLILFKQRKFYVYIKNISSAYFSDRDKTTRAQLPIRNDFFKIKNSDILFIFLGYDVINDVYVCWNFHEVKKRLNIGKSVSFYSRSFFQSEVEEKSFLRKKLKNGDTPVLFKRNYLIEFFNEIDTFFDNELEFKNTIEIKFNEVDFVNFLEKDKKLSQKSILNYKQALNGRIKLLVQKYLMNSFESIYQIDLIESLIDLKQRLLQIEEFKVLNKKGKNMYVCALDNYILYAKKSKENSYNIIDSKVEVVNSNRVINGKISKIIDEELLIEIKPHINSNRLLSAAQIVIKYYKGKYHNMELSDWLKILKEIK
jgi:hypothetical protein